MATPQVPPSITLQTFCCPHCGAYTTQFWYDLHAEVRTDKQGPPHHINSATVEAFNQNKEVPAGVRERLGAMLEKAASGEILLEDKNESHWSRTAMNLNASRCFACKKFAVWKRDSPIYPPAKTGPEPNADLPPTVLKDYEEAQNIVALSPRGAAALLRLAIQKLCKELNGAGKNIDADIAAMVKKGLSPLVQQSLDIVRVIGNESVHPGVLDIKDDLDTATKLFGLVNLIAEQMISTPKHVASLYGTLPESKRKAIEERDKGNK